MIRFLVLLDGILYIYVESEAIVNTAATSAELTLLGVVGAVDYG